MLPGFASSRPLTSSHLQPPKYIGRIKTTDWKSFKALETLVWFAEDSVDIARHAFARADDVPGLRIRWGEVCGRGLWHVPGAHEVHFRQRIQGFLLDTDGGESPNYRQILLLASDHIRFFPT
jgi:hypothetical protein